jgi:hypothetical protein
MVYSEWIVTNLDITKVMNGDLNYLKNESFQCFYKDKLIKEVIYTKFFLAWKQINI